MDKTKPLTKCPNCGTLAGEGKPHCQTTACTWNTCGNCNHHYNRFTGTHFLRDLKRT